MGGYAVCRYGLGCDSHHPFETRVFVGATETTSRCSSGGDLLPITIARRKSALAVFLERQREESTRSNVASGIAGVAEASGTSMGLFMSWQMRVILGVFDST